MVEKGVDLLTKRTQWEFLHEGKACGVHCRGPPGSRNGEYRDSDKMLCNICPLKREGRARVRDEMLYKSMQGTGLPSENLQASTDTYT